MSEVVIGDVTEVPSLAGDGVMVTTAEETHPRWMVWLGFDAVPKVLYSPSQSMYGLSRIAWKNVIMLGAGAVLSSWAR